MHIDPLEKKWAAISFLVVGFIVSTLLVSSLVHNIDTPGQVETIDSARLHLTEEFAEDNLGLQVDENGKITVRLVAGRYGFVPKHLTIPAETEITFRWVSSDVIHGVHIPMTNLNTMIVPGYVSQVTTELKRPGEYPVICNEYCGMGHAHMWSNITVIAKKDWLKKQNGDINNG